MSDGHYCLVRDLGLVKGGKGMKHHEVVVDFNRRGMVVLFKRLFSRLQKSVSLKRSHWLRVHEPAHWEEASTASVSAVSRPSPLYPDIG